MAKPALTWRLTLLLYLFLGTIVWAQVNVGSSGGGFFTFDGTNNTTTVPVLFPAGSASAPSIAWAADADGTGTGAFRAAANLFSIASNGTENFRVDTTGANSRILRVFGSVTFGSAFAGAGDTSMDRSGTGGALRMFSGTTPTSSNCGGAGLTLTGNNSNGSVVLGAAPALPCAIVFNGTWTSAPHCYLNPEILTTATTTVRATSITTTGFVITSTAALVATDKVTWWCVGE